MIPNGVVGWRGVVAAQPKRTVSAARSIVTHC